MDMCMKVTPVDEQPSSKAGLLNDDSDKQEIVTAMILRPVMTCMSSLSFESTIIACSAHCFTQWLYSI